MKVTQVYELVNGITQEILGDSVVVNEDLSNVVDIGTAIFNATDVDNYVRKLCNHIGRVIFVNRPYAGAAPSVLMDSWEYGSIMEKIQAELPEAVENESWELQDNASYDPNVFHKPVVSAKFFNQRVTFEIDLSFTEKQVKESFSNVNQLNGFMSMIYNAVDKAMTVKIDGLVMSTINHFIAETVYDEYPSADYSTKSTVKAVNLLKLYNDKFSASLTADECLTNGEFIRFASFMMGVYMDRMGRMSKLFNVGGKDRFTSKDMLHVVLLSDFAKAADAYLQSDTYHNEFTKLPEANTDVVPYWQGSGTDYSFAEISKIDVKTANNNTVTVDGILGVMFDRDALGVTNLERKVNTHYASKGDFYNNFYFFTAGYFNDTDENFVLFFVK